MTTLTAPSAAPLPTTRHERRTQSRRVRRRRRELWLVLLVIVAVAVPAVWVFTRGGPDSLTAVDRYPGSPPAEWGPEATWASPPLFPGTRPVVAGTDDVVLLTAQRRLMMIGAADGTVRWGADLPEGELTSPPTLTRIGGRDVVSAQVGARLLWWSRDDGSSDGLDLPSGATVSLLGEIPLVALGDGQVMAVTDDRPKPVALPAASTALAAHEDGQITAAGPAGWWHVLPDGSVGSSGVWENPARLLPTVVGYTGGFVILVRPGTPAAVEVHADRTTDVRYVFGGPVELPGGVGAPITWNASPSATWGVLGRTLVDLRAGRLQDLGAWSTRVVTADRAYGHIDGQTVVVGPRISRGALAPGEAVPDALTASGALVRGPDQSTADAADPAAGTDPRRPADTLYLLPPRRATS